MTPLFCQITRAGLFASAWFAAMLSASAQLSHIAANAPTRQPTITSGIFGKYPDGAAVTLFTMSNANGVEAAVMTHGATLVVVKAPDANGNVEAITLHKESWEEYWRERPLFGSTIGRFANRIDNARFSIDGREHKLERWIHGGGKQSAFQHLPWRGETLNGEGWVGVRLTLHSSDGQGGFPGNLVATVTYKLNASDELSIEYHATTDRPTHVNLTNHAYWNLAGADSGREVGGHVAQLYADRYLPTDDKLIPTGEIADVRNTPLDFTTPREIGARASQLPKGRYDHCFVVRKATDANAPPPVARVVEPESGRTLEVFATQPGVQFFTGNPRGFCLETQHFPDSPNKPRFPTTLLRPGDVYSHTAVFRFGEVSEVRVRLWRAGSGLELCSYPSSRTRLLSNSSIESSRGLTARRSLSARIAPRSLPTADELTPPK